MTPQDDLPPDLFFLSGGGEMGRRIAAFDWSTTALGPISLWPQTLKTTLSIMLRSTVPIVSLWREEGVMLYNDGYSVFAGERHPQLLGSRVREGWPEVADFNDHVMKTVLPGGTLTFKDQELVLRRHGALEPGWMDLDYSPVFHEGAPFGVICFVMETTEKVLLNRSLQDLNDNLEARVTQESAERRQTEAALQQAQKMESIGKLTGGVAHDFNNLLQVISGNLQLLAKDVAGNERSERRVTNALAGVSRGSKLASQLLAFGRRQPLEPRVLNVGRLVSGMDDLLRRTLGETIEIETIIAGGLWTSFVDQSQTENALLNLAINSRDAMERGGKLTIEAGNAYIDDAYARRYPDATPGQYVMVAVSDSGTGIPPEIIEKVFEPFFTTKPEGKGTGLGLSMVYGFVKQSGGHVRVYSEVGQGTTIRLYLPRAASDEDIVRISEIGPITGGTETILVAEDDEGVRETVVELLTDLGYRVLKARDAQSALTVIESGLHIDLLFTDVVMPGPLKSPELARRVRERMPHMAVLFTSGYTENSIVHDGKLDAGIDLLSKPYTREALALKIRQVLANKKK